MAEPRTYVVPETIKADLKRAYDSLHVAEDIAAKFRAAGEPDTDREAKTAMMREKLVRFAAAFDIPLE